MGLRNLGHLGPAASPGLEASPGLCQERTSSPYNLQALKSPVHMESWVLLKKTVILAGAPSTKGGGASCSCSSHQEAPWSAEVPIRIKRNCTFAEGTTLIRTERVKTDGDLKVFERGRNNAGKQPLMVPELFKRSLKGFCKKKKK